MAVPNQTYVNPNSNETCGVPGTDSWQILRAPIGSDMPWPGFLLGQTPASIWYWCADQIMVQKALSAKSLNHAQGTIKSPKPVRAGDSQENKKKVQEKKVLKSKNSISLKKIFDRIPLFVISKINF